MLNEPKGQTPGRQLGDWISNDAGAFSKLILVCSSACFRDSQVKSLLADFARSHSDRLKVQRPLLLVLAPGTDVSSLPAGLLTLDFRNPDDFALRLRQLVEALDLTPREAGVGRYLKAFSKWAGWEKPDPRFRDQVAEIFRISGATVTTSDADSALKFDLLIERRNVGVHSRTVIDCLDEEVARKQVGALLAKYKTTQTQAPGTACMVVTAREIPEDVRNSMTRGGIQVRTYPELLDSLLPLRAYVETLLSDLEAERQEKWEGQDWFIRPDVVLNGSSKRIPALEVISDWLGEKRDRLLALLGDLGTGKTTLASFVAYEMAQAYRKDPLRHPAPVLIKLHHVRKEIRLEGIVIAHFTERLKSQEMEEFSFARFEHLVRRGRIVLLFDAFDEMAERLRPQIMRENLKELIRPIESGGKVLLTARTHYFQNRAEHESLLGKGAVDLKEFTDEQVRKYLEKARPATKDKDWQRIQEIYNLKKLVERPLLLDMVVKTMRGTLSDDAASLYADYAEIWIDREKNKGRALDKKVKLRLMIELAWRIWHEEKDKIHVAYLLRAIQELEESRQFSFADLTVEEVTEEMRTASFLKRNDEGQYFFADPSFEEYFLACKIYECLRKPASSERIKAALRTRLFRPKVVFFLEKLIAKNGASYEPLQELLKEAYQPQISENALHLLYWSERIRIGMENEVTHPEKLRQAFGAHFPRKARLAGARLKEIVLEAADLSEADFSGAELTKANLNEAQLREACFRGATLVEAGLEGVQAAGADFREAQLSRATFRRANLENADFTGVINRGTIFEANQSAGMKGLNAAGGLRSSSYRSIVQQGFVEGFHSVAFDSQIGLCACSGPNGVVMIFRVQDGRLLHKLDGHRGRAALQFSPSGTLLVSGGMDGVVRLWSVGEGKLSNEHEEHDGRVNAVQFSPDGRWVASGGEDKTLHLWSVDHDQIRHSDGFQGDDSAITALDFSFDGRYLASGSENGDIRIWDVNTSFMVQVFRPEDAPPATVNVLRFSPDGRLLAVGGADRLIRIWSVGGKAKLLRTLRGHEGEVSAVHFSSDGLRLASGGKRGAVRLWWGGEKDRYWVNDIALSILERSDLFTNIMDPKLLKKAKAQLMSLREKEVVGREEFLHLLKTTMGDLPAAETVASCLESAMISPLLDAVREHGDWVGAVRFSGDGARLVSGSTDRKVRMWSTEGDKLQLIEETPDHLSRKQQAGIRVARIMPGVRMILTGGEEGQVCLWKDGECGRIQRLAGHLGPVRTLDVSPSGRLFVSGGEDRAIRIWGLEGSRLLHTISLHDGRVNSVRFSSKDGVLASGSDDRTIGLWLASTGQLSTRLTGHQGAVNVVRFSPDGALLASGSEDTAICFWGAGRGQVVKQLKTLSGHAGGVRAIEFSPDGKWLASAGRDRSIRLWQVDTGRFLRALKSQEAHLDVIVALRFLPDGQRLASGSEDGTVRIWDLNSGALLKTLTGHMGRVFSIDLSLDGNVLIAAGSAGRLQYWDLRTMETVLYRYAFDEGAWLDLLPDGRFHASEEGRRYLSYTELGELNSYPSDTMMTEFSDPAGVREVLASLHAGNF
ncbi:MAG: pentapeptide repeat-containing protein [Blastocatellia bacterium]|nr:pentapeptide repeat-containing protein [Blastocatellia bacterium]